LATEVVRLNHRNRHAGIAMSALIRVIASAIGTALLTRTMPSSLALAAELAATKNKSSGRSGAEKSAMDRMMRWDMTAFLCVAVASTTSSLLPRSL
jgi:hypothetical protein